MVENRRSGRSYVHGVGRQPLLGLTVGQLFDRAAEAKPDSEALVVLDQGVRWSWRELRSEVDRFAAGLLALGLAPGDRVGVWAPNCAEWVVAQLATARIGAVLVNINPAYRTRELEVALRQVGCRALILAASFKSSDYVELLAHIAPEITQGEADRDRVLPLEIASLPALEHVVVIGQTVRPRLLEWEAVAGLAGEQDHGELVSLGSRLQFDDPINIQFTSGTTGAPKAATLTHHNIVNNAWLVGARMALGPDDRLCIPVPLYHCFGMVLGTLVCIARGATMILPSAGFDAAATLRAIDQERCTALHGVPTMFIAELEHPDFSACDTSHLRTGIMAGAPCPVELMHRVRKEMNLREITIAYGMTETSPVSFQTSVDDPVERRVETVGRALPHTEIKIVDQEGHVLPVGEEGELLTRGYCVMRGYWGDPVRTAEAIDDAGWLHSGDVATLDEDGYCRIVGRIKDMLIRGGENIFPREIEEYLYTHPKVEEVEVFGVPDEKYGEEICAWIKLKEGESATDEEIRDFCRDRIAHFKIPRYVRFVDEYPLTATGKVKKFEMRATMADELAAGSRSA